MDEANRVRMIEANSGDVAMYGKKAGTKRDHVSRARSSESWFKAGPRKAFRRVSTPCAPASGQVESLAERHGQGPECHDMLLRCLGRWQFLARIWFCFFSPTIYGRSGLPNLRGLSRWVLSWFSDKNRVLPPIPMDYDQSYRIKIAIWMVHPILSDRSRYLWNILKAYQYRVYFVGDVFCIRKVQTHFETDHCLITATLHLLLVFGESFGSEIPRYP